MTPRQQGSPKQSGHEAEWGERGPPVPLPNSDTGSTSNNWSLRLNEAARSRLVQSGANPICGKVAVIRPAGGDLSAPLGDLPSINTMSDASSREALLRAS